MATRKEVEAAIRASKFRCRGKKVLSDPQISELRKAYEAMKTLPELVKFKESLEDGHKIAKVAVASLEEATARIGNLIYAYGDTVGRAICGQDVGELIIAGKLDGQEHVVKCPKCGEMLDYTPAVAEGEGVGTSLGSPAQFVMPVK